MIKSAILVASALAAFGMLSIDAAAASGGRAPGGAIAPLGFSVFCLNHPQQCRSSGKSSIAASADVMAVLTRVNSSVNRTIKPRYDVGADTWTVNPSSGYGDCEDYAMTKRSQLIRSGLPASALRIAYVQTARGEAHAVLVVRTSDRELVLDNLTGAVLPLDQTGLRLVSISSANPTQWVKS